MHIVQVNHNRLLLEFSAASSDVEHILVTLHDDLLPQLQLEFAFSDADTAWLSEWLSDTASIFRLLRRHKFIRPFTLQAIRSISIWRMHFHCLPPPAADPLGHPIIFLKLAPLQSFPCSVKDALLQEIERLRLHLRYIRDHCTHTGSFPLQYLLLLDLDGISIQKYNLDLCSWIITDIMPRYPGMFAAVFLLNYSWIHSGAWSLAKRVLPSSVIARVFFLSKEGLVRFCSAANLPSEYGGLLPTLDRIDDALRSPYQVQHLPPPPPPRPNGPATPEVLRVKNNPFHFSPSLTPPSNAALQRAPSTIVLRPLSSRNPFYGYPAVASAVHPHTIRHVRRGKRELVRTLAVLWWRRWRRWVWAGTWASTCAVVCMLLLRMRRAKTMALVLTSLWECMTAIKARLRHRRPGH